MENETKFIEAKKRVESKLYFTAHDFTNYKRDDFAVNFIPEQVKQQQPDTSVIALSSATDGNCLYSAISLQLAGNNSLVSDLRFLTCWELYHNAKYYANHQIIEDMFQSCDLFKTKSGIFSVLISSVTFEKFDNDDFDSSVRFEAMHSLTPRTWSPFLCLIAMASVIKRNIVSVYPDCGAEKYKLIFNRIITPRDFTVTESRPLTILWSSTCRLGENFSKFQPNHIVPLVRIPITKRPAKRKSDQKSNPNICCNKKQKVIVFPLSTSSSVKPATTKPSLPHSGPILTANLNTNTTASAATTLSSATTSSTFTITNSISCSTSTTTSTCALTCTSSSTGQDDILLSISVKNQSTTSALNSYASSSIGDQDEKLLSTSVKNEATSPDASASINGLNDISILDNQPRPVGGSLQPVISPEKAHKYDIGLYISNIDKMNDDEIFDLIKNIWVPPANFEFPSSKSRKFSRDWLNIFPRLCYSAYLDGAFCIPCVFFGRHSKENSALKNLYTQPLRDWKSARGRLNDHFGSKNKKDNKTEKCKCKVHQDAVCLFTGFMLTMSQREKAIHNQLNKQRNEERIRNREAIKSISDTVIFLGREALPFRGKHDDSKYHANVGEHSENGVGIFQNLLNFQVKRGDTVLRDHLATAAKNAMYTSAPIQNQLIDCAGNVISKKLVKEINHSSFFALLADEATDCSNKEQLAIVLRFVDANNNIREEFFKFVHLNTGLKGIEIKKKLLSSLRDAGIDMGRCRGQGYDGAGNMAGIHRGCASLITSEYSKAIYFHCSCHRLNLAVQQTCAVPRVRNVMDIIKQISYFYNLSPKRQQHLEKCAKTECPDVPKEKLVDVCRTRWVTRIDGMKEFQMLLPAVVASLEEMDENENNFFSRDTSSMATSFLKTLTSFDFIVSLVVARCVLDYARPATVKLQKKERDILEGYNLVETLRNTIKHVLNEVDSYHRKWYEEALDLARELGTEEKMPRFAKRSIYRDNPPATTPSDYFRQSVTIPAINHLLTELDERFNDSNKPHMDVLNIIPDLMISAHYTNMDWRASVRKFVLLFVSDMPSSGSLEAELDIWFTFWSEHFVGDKPDTIAATLKLCDKDTYPNIHTILNILAVIPITTCSCERTISALRRLKTYTRSTMGDDRLNGLALLHIHKDIPVSSDEVLDEFTKHPRRLLLV